MPGIGRRGMFCRALAVLALALCCVLTLAAAGADSPKIELSEEWIVLGPNETAKLTAEVTGYSGKATVAMASSNPLVA